MTRALAPLAVTLTLFLMAGAVQADAIRPSDHPGCDLELRGEIRPGVADALDMDRIFDMVTRPIYLSEGGVDLCLDSPGGSLAEAMAMFEAIRAWNITTRIPIGWRCESACAIAFMAGSLELGVGVPTTIGSHRLDPGGVLGFHAPSLDLPDNRMHSSEEVSRAFAVALQAAGTLHRASLREDGMWRSFSTYLYTRLLETPPYTMYRIDNVGNAILADITLGPVVIPDRITKREIENLCDAAYIKELFPLELRIPKGESQVAWENLRGADLREERRDWLQQTRNVQILQIDGKIIGRVGGYDPDRFYATGCNVEIDPTWAARGFTAYSQFDSTEGVQVGFYLYQIYDLDEQHADGSAPLRTSWQPDPDYLQTEIHVPLWFMHDPATPLAALVPEIDTPLENQGATHFVHTQPGWMVNIRTGPGNDHPVLREVAHGTVVMQLMYNGDGWTNVELPDGTSGWVAARLLAPL